MSDDRPKPYPFDQFEPAWQARWDAGKTFHTPNPGEEGFDPAKPKFYVLDMFPYPSGSGLHVGHPEGYTATDILGRTKRRQGFNVLHPMGWDSFGLPAEQYAIKTGQHPRKTTEANIENFRRQLKSLGFAYDWDREIATTDPEYVRWTQWIFLQLYHSYFDEETGKARPVSELEEKGWTRDQIDDVRLAYVTEAPVNWSPDLGTVLANEEVEEWRAKGHTVERRPLRQWMLRITKYAQRLIDELEPLDWPESIKLLQRNWIGRSEGAAVEFEIPNSKSRTVEVFTTRPDTLFGATYMVLAPEHPLVAEITTPEQKEAVEQYVKACASKSDMERGDLNKDKTGVFTGAYAVNPVNDEKIPVWIADYVMMGYGTGAIMAVPAHDTRDFEFATKFGLPIVQVVSRSAGVPPASQNKLPADGGPKDSYPYDDPQQSYTFHSHRLPHWEQDGKTYFVTWRLADSLPKEKLDAWHEERKLWLDAHPEPWTEKEEEEYHAQFSKSIDAWLDQGSGECLLKDPKIAQIVSDALKHFDGDRYLLDAFVVMPNHVHVLFRLKPGEDLTKVIHSWKSYTAKKINKALGREGTIWQREYWDRLVRGPKHHHNVRKYILLNPEHAKLKEGQFVLFEGGGAKGGTNVGDAGETPALLDTTNAHDAGETPVRLEEAFTEEGVSINSGLITGLPTAEAKKKITEWLEEQGKGRRKVQYKLRDWLFSRQRYWGEPFPIVWENGRHRAVPEDELPVLQPEMDDFKPTGDPRGPLVKATEWIRYSETAQRETNTMPQWAGSCWYYLRYCDPKNTERFVAPQIEQYWAGGATPEKPGMVDLYVGGTEHAVLHLLYARFWHKVLHDLGHVSTNEPFQRLVNQGLILGEDGRKMSKSFGNVVNPDDVVRDYGADALRLYEMFMGPLEQVKPWSMKGVEGVSRFLARVWRVAFDLVDEEKGEWKVSEKLQQTPCTDKALLKTVHETIKKVTEDVERLNFNTAISQMMVCTNAFTQAQTVPLAEFTQLLHVLNPFAPHLTEEIHQRLCKRFGIEHTPLSESPWPKWDETALVETEVEIVVQVNGKLRDKIRVPKDAPKEEVEAAALAAPKVVSHTEGKTVRKVIVVPGRLVNVVAN